MHAVELKLHLLNDAYHTGSELQGHVSKSEWLGRREAGYQGKKSPVSKAHKVPHLVQLQLELR